jgi:hypothetical protein
MSLREVYNRHCHTARQERALLSAIGFTSTFTAARLITHSIRAGIGPFHNISEGRRHIHHSTFGIFGLLGIGYLWTYDEFALWLDLHDDYWGANRSTRLQCSAGCSRSGLRAATCSTSSACFPSASASWSSATSTAARRFARPTSAASGDGECLQPLQALIGGTQVTAMFIDEHLSTWDVCR